MLCGAASADVIFYSVLFYSLLPAGRYALDGTAFGARSPLYAGLSAVPAGWTRSPHPGAEASVSASAYWLPGTKGASAFSLDSTYWVHNLVR